MHMRRMRRGRGKGEGMQKKKKKEKEKEKDNGGGDADGHDGEEFPHSIYTTPEHPPHGGFTGTTRCATSKGAPLI